MMNVINMQCLRFHVNMCYHHIVPQYTSNFAFMDLNLSINFLKVFQIGQDMKNTNKTYSELSFFKFVCLKSERNLHQSLKILNFVNILSE